MSELPSDSTWSRMLSLLPDDTIRPKEPTGGRLSSSVTHGEMMSILPTSRSPLLAPATLGEDHLSHATPSELRIVLYKERHIVIYDQKSRRLEARLLTARDETTLRTRRTAFCPMCGQTIDPLHFTFQAQAYFLLLQDVFQSHFRNGSAAQPFAPVYTERRTASGGSEDMAVKDAESESSSEGSGQPPQRRRVLKSHFGLATTTSPPQLGSGATAMQIQPTETLSPRRSFLRARQLPPFKSEAGSRWSLAADHSSEEEGGEATGVQKGDKGSSARGGATTAAPQPYPEPQHLPKAMFATGYYFNFFREIRKLGSGSFGQVFLCHHVLDDLFLGEYAVKKVPVGDDKNWLKKMLREVKIRERLHHANIVEYKHSWLEMHAAQPHLPIIPWLFVLMECCNAGDLETYLMANDFYPPLQGGCFAFISFPDSDYIGLPRNKREKQFLDESHIWKFFFDVGNGLNHLHHSGILHRDLKPSNILLHCTLDTLTGKPTTTAMLSDFGTSELFGEPEKRMGRQGFTGTVEYTAPELLEVDEDGNFKEDYDERSDLWSLGIVLYLLTFGYLPFTSDEPATCRRKILEAPHINIAVPHNSPARSPDLLQLIEALLQREPSERPSLDEVLFHKRIHRRATDMEAMTKAGQEIAFSFVRGPREPPLNARTQETSASEVFETDIAKQLPDNNNRRH